MINLEVKLAACNIFFFEYHISAVISLNFRLIGSRVISYHPEISHFHYCCKLSPTVVRLGPLYILGISYFTRGHVRGCLFDALCAMYSFLYWVKCKGHISAKNVITIPYKFLCSSNWYPGKPYWQNNWNTWLGTRVMFEVLRQFHRSKCISQGMFIVYFGIIAGFLLQHRC